MKLFVLLQDIEEFAPVLCSLLAIQKRVHMADEDYDFSGSSEENIESFWGGEKSDVTSRVAPCE